MRVIYVSTHYNERGLALRDAHPDDLVMLLDIDRCIGCGTCFQGCLAEHGPEPALARPIALGVGATGRASQLLNLPGACPACSSPCPYAAGSFWTFCPADRVNVYSGEVCDKCVDRLAQGLMPACATRCAMKCLYVGRAADIHFALAEKRLRNMGEAEFLP